MFARLMRMLTTETLNGFQHPDVVEVIFQKTLSYAPQVEWSEIAGASTVLDFGGGCGRHYKEALLTTPNVRWAVVEIPAMVGRAKELETDKLRFFTNIRAAADWLVSIDVMHSNGAIQYTPHPINIVNELCALSARRLLWYRINFKDSPEIQISRLADHGPAKMRGIRNANVATEYSRITETDFIAAHSAYRLDERGDDWFRFSSASER